MSYVDDVYSRVVEQNPSQPEFHQAVKEVLESLRPVIESDEEKYRKEALLERLTTPDRQILFRVSWVDDNGQVQVIMVIVFNLIMQLGLIRVGFVYIHQFT